MTKPDKKKKVASQRVLVLGAQPFSLGSCVAGEAMARGIETITAGISGEAVNWDARTTDVAQCQDLLELLDPDHVVCTAGINEPMKMGDPGFEASAYDSFQVNALGPLALATAFVQRPTKMPGYGHFVAISSNSAQIARRRSAAYCMSKAALSMGLRVLARENADQKGVLVYGYEPGYLFGTPMSRGAIGAAFAGKPPHRIPGSPPGLDPGTLAHHILDNLQHGGRELNGAILRLDGGEQ